MSSFSFPVIYSIFLILKHEYHKIILEMCYQQTYICISLSYHVLPLQKTVINFPRLHYNFPKPFVSQNPSEKLVGKFLVIQRNFSEGILFVGKIFWYRNCIDKNAAAHCWQTHLALPFLSLLLQSYPKILSKLIAVYS